MTRRFKDDEKSGGQPSVEQLFGFFRAFKEDMDAAIKAEELKEEQFQKSYVKYSKLAKWLQSWFETRRRLHTDEEIKRIFDGTVTLPFMPSELSPPQENNVDALTEWLKGIKEVIDPTIDSHFASLYLACRFVMLKLQESAELQEKFDKPNVTTELYYRTMNMCAKALENFSTYSALPKSQTATLKYKIKILEMTESYYAKVVKNAGDITISSQNGESLSKDAKKHLKRIKTEIEMTKEQFQKRTESLLSELAEASHLNSAASVGAMKIDSDLEKELKEMEEQEEAEERKAASEKELEKFKEDGDEIDEKELADLVELDSDNLKERLSRVKVKLWGSSKNRGAQPDAESSATSTSTPSPSPSSD